MITAGVVGKLEHSFDHLKLFRAKFLSKYKVTSTRQVHVWSYSSLFLVDARENVRCTKGLHVRMHAVPQDCTWECTLYPRDYTWECTLYPRDYTWECTPFLVDTRENARCTSWECMPYLGSTRENACRTSGIARETFCTLLYKTLVSPLKDT